MVSCGIEIKPSAALTHHVLIFLYLVRQALSSPFYRPRLRDRKQFVQDHIANKQQSLGMNQVISDSKVLAISELP